jgi:3-hydroxyacyl-[acyl-carrier-protein] dehydratase
MPVQPLVDLAALDLSRTLFGPRDLERILRQRGRFAIVDGVLHLDPATDFVVGFKDVRADDWWARDHIPGRPIFPGMLMVEASAQLGTFDFFQRRPEIENTFVGFVGIDNTRFRAAVEPPCRLILVGKRLRTRATMFTYGFQGFVDGKVVFESEVTGMRM